MRAPTEEEQRAEDYRRSAVKRKRAMAERRRKLRGNSGARAQLARNWKPLLVDECGDTSYPENRK